MTRLRLAAAAAAFLALAIHNNLGFLGYVLRTPGSLGTRWPGWVLAADAAPAALFLALAALFWGAGAGLLRRLKVPEPPAGAAFAVGLGAAAQALFLLGLLGLLRPAWMLALALGALIVAWPELRRLAGAGAPSLRAASPPLWKGACAAALLFGAWHAAIFALAPPTEWDVLAYHLSIPKIYLARGAVREIPWMVHSHWPHLMEVLYAAPLAAGMDTVAAMLHAAAWAALVFCAFSTARRNWGEPAGWSCAALLAVQPVPMRFAGTAHSDGALALFHALAALSVWSWERSGSRRQLALAGFLAGLAACAKLSGAALFALLAALILLRRRAPAQAALFLACGAAMAGPWYLKTWVWAGNPVWPFLSSIFGGDFGADSVRAAAHSDFGGWRWLLDWNLVSLQGPQWLLLPAAGLTGLAAVSRRAAPPPLIRFLCAPALPFLLLVIQRTSAWRYMWPFYPAFALAAGWGFAQLTASANARLRAAALALLGLGLWPALSAEQNNQLFAVAGARSALRPEEDPRALYLEKSLEMYRFCREASRNFPSAKVLLFREIRGYYLDLDYVWGDPSNQGLIRYSAIPDSPALEARLRELGITHVWVNEGARIYAPSPRYYDSRTVSLMEGVLRTRARPVLSAGANTLFELIGP